MSTKPSTPAACPPQPRRRDQLSGIFTIALAALLSLLITAAPARANLCCNPLTNACLVAVTGSCPGGFYLIPGAACSPNPCFATWSVGPWSACSTTCGPGIQTRTVQCTIAGTILPDSQCATAGAKPATTQSCNSGPCDSFVWTTGAWGSCSAPCGGGTRTRTVACISVITGAVVSDALCTGTRPQSSEACNTQPCLPAEWTVGDWSACSTTCGPGIQTRTVQCTLAGAVVADAQCANAGPKPATTQPCNPGPCDTYEWTVGSWSACSAPCGGGTRTRTVACISVITGTVVSDALCTGTRPQSSEACNTQPCLPAEWTVGDWSACSTTCGPGIQTRTVQCTIAGGVVADFQCVNAGPRPATTQPCNPGPCDTYEWAVGPWDACSAPCGGGTRTRTVNCVSVLTGAVVSDTLCSSTARPDSSEPCNTDPCAQPQWTVGDWDACSTTCGPGIQTRTVQCTLAGVVVADAQCASAGPRPKSTQSCNLGACGVWIVGDWSDCSAPCGQSVRTRSVLCVADGQTVPDSRCALAGPRPASFEICTAPPCTGACCLGSTCIVLSPQDCSVAGGRTIFPLAACSTYANIAALCCFADFNASGSVTVQDLFDYLAAYFAADPRADFNISTTITVQDLFDYLAAYFAGC